MGLVYQALLTAAKPYFLVENKRVELLPGMMVTSEIKIRKKRIIDYFLDPFKTYKSESMRER